MAERRVEPECRLICQRCGGASYLLVRRQTHPESVIYLNELQPINGARALQPGESPRCCGQGLIRERRR